MADVAAVILDVVGSRNLDDRAAAQRAITDAFAQADAIVAPVQHAWATFADEFQAIYRTIGEACAATGLVRLALAGAADVRFGIGIGTSREVAPGATGPVLDGDAWWRARSAIEEAERRGARTGTRTWAAGRGSDNANAALLLRDHLISAMRPREQRITMQLILGLTQREIAENEGITQAAVSQAAKKSGAGAVAQSYEAWIQSTGQAG